MSDLRRLIAGTLQPLAFAARQTGHGWGHRILMYHRIRDTPGDQLSVSISQFTEQMRYLSAHRRVLSLQTVCEETGKASVREPGVAVTFDDGYTDNLKNALPILERFGVPAVVFTVSGFCDGTRRHPRYPDESALHLNREELRQLAAHPLIEIGSHTVTHPLLSQISEPQARAEIHDSRLQLESLLGKPVRYFCYPSGDFQAREVELLGTSGYSAAVTVAPGVNRPGTPRFRLRRTEVTDRDDATDLAMKLDGAYDLPHTLLHWRRQRRFRKMRQIA